MSSTYTTRIRLEKQGSGENASTWGDKLNESVIDLVDSAVGAVTSISLAGVGDAYTVSSADGVSDEARSAVLYFHGSVSTAVSITIPAVEKKLYYRKLNFWWFWYSNKTCWRYRTNNSCRTDHPYIY